jgi:ribosomal protein L7Ae-like RNA K-turn-binding protein
MKQVSKEYIKSKKLKLIGSIADTDMSKIILKMERLKEDKSINYYSVDLILFNQETHMGEIRVSFWGEK